MALYKVLLAHRCQEMSLRRRNLPEHSKRKDPKAERVSDTNHRRNHPGRSSMNRKFKQTFLRLCTGIFLVLAIECFRLRYLLPKVDGSSLSCDSVDGKESVEVLPPYSSHRSKLPQFYSPSHNAVKKEIKMDDSLRLDDNAKGTSVPKLSSYPNGDAVRRPKHRSVESSGPESRHSISDSGLHISQEEMFLLGSVKPRAGRRKRKTLKQTASETLHHVRVNVEEYEQLLGPSPRRDRSFLETTL